MKTGSRYQVIERNGRLVTLVDGKPIENIASRSGTGASPVIDDGGGFSLFRRRRSTMSLPVVAPPTRTVARAAPASAAPAVVASVPASRSAPVNAASAGAANTAGERTVMASPSGRSRTSLPPTSSRNAPARIVEPGGGTVPFSAPAALSQAGSAQAAREELARQAREALNQTFASLPRASGSTGYGAAFAGLRDTIGTAIADFLCRRDASGRRTVNRVMKGRRVRASLTPRGEEQLIARAGVFGMVLVIAAVMALSGSPIMLAPVAFVGWRIWPALVSSIPDEEWERP